MKKDWGIGIPEFQKSDLMTEHEKLNFAREIVFNYEINPNGYEVVTASEELIKIPNYVLKKDGFTIFVVVEAAIAPDMPKLTPDKKSLLLSQAKNFNVICYYAPVGFGSVDPERFEASLALRGDRFYANYCGLERVVDQTLS